MRTPSLALHLGNRLAPRILAWDLVLPLCHLLLEYFLMVAVHSIVEGVVVVVVGTLEEVVVVGIVEEVVVVGTVEEVVVVGIVGEVVLVHD